MAFGQPTACLKESCCISDLAHNPRKSRLDIIGIKNGFWKSAGAIGSAPRSRMRRADQRADGSCEAPKTLRVGHHGNHDRESAERIDGHDAVMPDGFSLVLSTELRETFRIDRRRVESVYRELETIVEEVGAFPKAMTGSHIALEYPHIVSVLRGKKKAYEKIRGKQAVSKVHHFMLRALGLR